VSDHPLLGQQDALAAVTECSIGELLGAEPPPGAALSGAEAGEDRVVTLAGILSGVQRKVTRQGDAWAQATLEDLDGAVEVMFFPAVYRRRQDLLTDDAIVLVRGRLDRSEDPPRLVAMDVTPAGLD
jgi:DNA polymerase-3 subunit alpha